MADGRSTSLPEGEGRVAPWPWREPGSDELQVPQPEDQREGWTVWVPPDSLRDLPSAAWWLGPGAEGSSALPPWGRGDVVGNAPLTLLPKEGTVLEEAWMLQLQALRLGLDTRAVPLKPSVTMWQAEMRVAPLRRQAPSLCSAPTLPPRVQLPGGSALKLGQQGGGIRMPGKGSQAGGLVAALFLFPSSGDSIGALPKG